MQPGGRLAAEQLERERAEQEARRKQAEIEKELASARQFLDSGQTSQAVASLQESVRKFPQSKELRAQLDLAILCDRGDPRPERGGAALRQRKPTVGSSAAVPESSMVIDFDCAAAAQIMPSASAKKKAGRRIVRAAAIMARSSCRARRR